MGFNLCIDTVDLQVWVRFGWVYKLRFNKVYLVKVPHGVDV